MFRSTWADAEGGLSSSGGFRCGTNPAPRPNRFPLRGGDQPEVRGARDERGPEEEVRRELAARKMAIEQEATEATEKISVHDSVNSVSSCLEFRFFH